MKRGTPAHIALFVFHLLITAGLVFLLALPLGELPPVGKFFDPFGGFWQNAEGSMLVKSETVEISGLQGEVVVNMDERLVPHIFADNLHDLYFMQGYISARYRLWQMDMQSRAAAGRLAEIAGEKAVPLDILARRLGLPVAARNSVELMMADAQSRQILEAYSAGVNAHIQELDYAKLPFEFKLMNYQPEPWSPYKTALLLKYMANLLAGYETDIENTNTIALFGKETFNVLFPNFPDTLLDPVIPVGTVFSKPSQIPKAPSDSNRVISHDLIRPVPNKPEADLGSNNWAIAGSRSKSGRPILCNDPHLALNLPSIWFEIQLHSEGMNVYGASIPGAPCVISGFNDSIAWGITNAAMDVKDWYEIRFRDASRKEYLLDGQWKKAGRQIESIRVKGGATVYDTIIHTEWGPIAYDAYFNKGYGSRNLALKWTAHEAGNELLTFFFLNKASNYTDYLEALNTYNCPGQNFVFASGSGDIAIRQQGLFVNRYPGQGNTVMDGTNSAYSWQGYIPDSANPAILNPPRGWVSSANQHPVDSTWPYAYQGSYEYYRNRRINEQLASLEKSGIKEMMLLQNDNYNLYAREGLPILLKYIRMSQLGKDERVAVGYLLKWDFFSDPDKLAPVFFEAWWKHFKNLLWDEFENQNEVLIAPGTFQTIRYLQKNPVTDFADIKSTPEKEDLSILCHKSLQQAVNEIMQWKRDHPELPLIWANYKGTSIQHLSRQKAFGLENVQIGGNSSIVNACGPKNGPSWRMIVSPGTKGEAYGIYPGGQSGNPGSRYYDNFISDWSKGQYYPLKVVDSKDKDKRIWYIIHAHGAK